jgi:hypothetical protein
MNSPVDQGELDEAVEPQTEVLGALDLCEARVVGDVRDHHRLAEFDGSPRDREVREFVDGARERLVDRRAVRAHETHEAFAFDRGDAAARRGGRETHAGRHRVEDLGKVERCSELEALLRKHAELLVGGRGRAPRAGERRRAAPDPGPPGGSAPRYRRPARGRGRLPSG